MSNMLAQGAPGAGMFFLELYVLMAASIAGLFAIFASISQPARLMLAMSLVVIGMVLPIAGYVSSDGGLIYWFYPVFAFPSIPGLIALLRFSKGSKARGFEVLPPNRDGPGNV